ncbi:MAG: hypothetical protein K6G85_10100 [Eubacterium sp.]|nr:hypothetical protein [Eubacterium sp.]
MFTPISVLVEKIKQDLIDLDLLEYGDLTTKIILNTKGTKGTISKDLKTFLAAVDGIFQNNDFSNTIKEEYDKIKKNTELRREYMTLGLELLEQYQRGKKEGREEGILVGQEIGFNVIEALKSGISVREVAEKYGIDEETVLKYQKALSE